MTPAQKREKTLKSKLLEQIRDVYPGGIEANKIGLHLRRFLRVLETESKIVYKGDGWYYKF